MSRFSLPQPSDFFAGYRDGARMPFNVERLAEQVRIKGEALAYAANRGSLCAVDGPYTHAELLRGLDDQDRVSAELMDRAERRSWERALADRLYELSSKYYDLDLKKLADSLHECRQHGSVGVHEDGTRVFMWDHKCGQVRLCPDEAREEQQRIVNKYQPLLETFKDRKPTHRLFYVVLTMPNDRPGQLLNMKKRQFARLKKWLAQFPQIKGALACQEDPLSAGHQWHVHMNLMLCVEGEFNYQEAHAAWCPQDDNGDVSEHWQTWFEEAPRRGQTVRESLIELCKYAAKPVGRASYEKAAAGETEAPGMTDWPDELLYEWIKAQKGFRRVRGYGCVYAAHRQRWDGASYNERETLWNIARHIDEDTAGPRSNLVCNWCDFSEPLKALMRRAMDEGIPDEHGEVTWIGRVSYDQLLAVYDVNLITGNNFFGDTGAKDNFSRAGPVPLSH